MPSLLPLAFNTSTSIRRPDGRVCITVVTESVLDSTAVDALKRVIELQLDSPCDRDVFLGEWGTLRLVKLAGATLLSECGNVVEGEVKERVTRGDVRVRGVMAEYIVNAVVW